MLVAAFLAGPWPSLAASSLFWRAPLAAALLLAALRHLPRRLVLLVAPVMSALAIDAVCPVRLTAQAWTARAATVLARVQTGLAALTERSELRRVLAPGGGEAEPEAPFALLARLASDLPVHPDSLVLLDERGQPVAWAGSRARLPIRLRALGERALVAEPALREAWVWWREPVLDGGRVLGGLLVGVAMPETGGRTALGVWAGRAAIVTPLWEGGEPLLAPSGARVVGIVVDPAVAATWSASALAALLALVLIAWEARGAARAALAVAALAGIAAHGWLFGAWWLVLSLGALALGLAWLGGSATQRRDASAADEGRDEYGEVVSGKESSPAAGAVALASTTWREWLRWGTVAVVVGVVGWLLTGVLAELSWQSVPERLLVPGAARWALIITLTLLLRGAGGAPAPFPLRIVAWLPLAVGVARGEPALLGVGAGLVALVGMPAGSSLLAALAAAGLLLGSDRANARNDLVATTESTLARLESEERPARALLLSLPESALEGLIRLSPAERTVVLGRLADWLGFAETLPGASLAIIDPQGELAGAWGEAIAGEDLTPRELASREVHGGWRVVVLVPPFPYDVPAALAAEGLAGPSASYDRSGAPAGRGATFRPLSPERVGRALAEGRSWGKVRLGEREYQAYLRAHGERVLAVPLISPPVPELGLQLAALTLWGALPVGVGAARRRWFKVWEQRYTFAGRVRLLTAAAALLPLLLLGYFLPLQWSRQQNRARLELGRAVSQPLLAAGLEQHLSWLVRQMGGAVALYRGGALEWSSRPDLAFADEVPLMAPPEAYVRAVRGWREPLVEGESVVNVFAPLPGGEGAVVIGVLGLQVAVGGDEPSPREWFVITAVLAAGLALLIADRLGRRLTGPLRRLVMATRRLGQGQRVAGLEVAGDEEVAELSRAFLSMADQVERRAEELRAERDLLDRVLRTLSAAVVVCRTSGQVEVANPAARQLLGESLAIWEFAERFAPALVAALARGARGEAVGETLHPAGKPESLWRATVIPLAGLEGRLLLVMEDLSEVARAERLASLAELARIVAHEVKNPLTPIRLWAEELQASLARRPKDVVAVAEVAAGQILERVAHLREVAQGFSNLVALEHWEPEPVDAVAVAREVVSEYAVLGQRAVSVGLVGETEGWVLADRKWLGRAMRHLLENSVRAIGERAGRVVIDVSLAAQELVVAVRDSGGGVSQSHLARLFQPHFSTTSEGTGLGLAVVQRVVTRAGGRVEASNVGEGLEVRLIFPVVGNLSVQRADGAAFSPPPG